MQRGFKIRHYGIEFCVSSYTNENVNADWIKKNSDTVIRIAVIFLLIADKNTETT